MKNQELYEKTVGILVDAYFNDTLVHGLCSACAVGNIIASNLGIDPLDELSWVEKTGNFAAYGWGLVFSTGAFGQTIRLMYYYGAAQKQIEASGYDYSDLAKIEYAFESADRGASADEYMFNGLMAVIEVLDIIHENTDTEVTVASKKKFNKVIQ